MALSSSEHGKDVQDLMKKFTSAVVASVQLCKYFAVFQKENAAGIAGGKCVMCYHENGCTEPFIDTLNGRQQHL